MAGRRRRTGRRAITAIHLAATMAPYDRRPVAWKILVAGGGWVSWESNPPRMKSSPPELAWRIRSASLPWAGRPLVRLDHEQAAYALATRVLEELGLRAEAG